MKTYNGCSSETKKCLFCNKNISDYVVFEVQGISIQIDCHNECFNLDLTETMKKTFRKLKENIKIEQHFQGSTNAK